MTNNCSSKYGFKAVSKKEKRVVSFSLRTALTSHTHTTNTCYWLAFGLESEFTKLDVTEYVDPMKTVLSKVKRPQKAGWLL